MRTLINRFILCLPVILLAPLASAAEQDTSSHPLTDEQKMEQVKKYFESPYQEEDYFRTDRLLLTATGNLIPVRKAPSVATVITAEDIEKMGARTLSEALQTVPGLFVEPSGFNRFTPTYSIRGMHTRFNSQTLLLINGVPMREAYNGTRPPTFQMSTAFISRIEVVRGPVSAIHGADAFAGVINVITKEGQELEGSQLDFRGGSFETYDGSALHGDVYSGWDVMWGLAYMKSNGDDDRIIEADAYGSGAPPSDTPRPLDTHYDNYEALFSLMKNNCSLKLYGSWQDDNSMGPGSQYITDKNWQNNKTILGDMSYRNDTFVDDFEFTIKLSGHYSNADQYWQLTPPTFLNLIGEPITTTKNGAIDLIGVLTKFDNHRLRSGIGYSHLKMETDEYRNFDLSYNPIPWGRTKYRPDLIYSDDQSRDLVYISFQDEWDISRSLELTAGIRYDHYSDFGNTVNPRLALVWEIQSDLVMKLLYGEAFRPPTFAELHAKNNPLAWGNSNVGPEEIKTVEWAIDYQPTSNFRTLFNLFHYEAEGIIEYIGGATKTAQNARDQEGYGFELEASWQMFRKFLLKGNIAYQHSEDMDTGATVPDAPQWQAYMNAHWDFLPTWSLDLQFYWIADRPRAAGDTRDDIDDYELVHCTLRRKDIVKNWDLAVGVQNLFDEDARIPSDGRVPNDYPMQGRSFFGELRVHF